MPPRNSNRRRDNDAMRFLRFLHPEDETVFEMRILKPIRPFSDHWERSGNAPLGFYQEKQRAIDHALSADADEEVNPTGIYVTLNPVRNGLLSRANERLRAGVSASRDNDVPCFRNLLIDLDPERQQGINSSNAEHQAAVNLASNIQFSLRELGWPEPYSGSSGNGAVLIYRLPSLPNDDCHKRLVRNLLAVLAARFNTESVKIDETVGNASRIVRLTGTLNRKGDSTDDRPQRVASIISIPRQPEPVRIELLQDLVGQVSNEVVPSASESACGPRQGTLDVRRYLDHYGRAIIRERTHGESTLFILERCVFNPDHADGESAIGLQPRGLLFYQCFHNSCRDKTWREARQIISGNDSIDSFFVGDSCTPTSVDSGTQGITCCSFAELLSMPEDTTPPVLEGLLYPRESLLITGPSAIGKSTMVLQLCIAFASGRLFLGRYATIVPRRVLLIQAENTQRTIRDRLRRMTLDFTGERQRAFENIFTPRQGIEPQLIGSITDGRGNPTPFVDTLRSLIDQVHADIVLFDPLICYHGADENDNTGVRKALDILSRLSNQYNLNVVLTHHHNKQYRGNSDQDGFSRSRGASVITDWASTILTLQKKSPRSGRQNGHYLSAVWTKVRSFRPPDPLYLELLQGATFRVLDQVTRPAQEIDIGRVFVTIPERRIINGSSMIEAIESTFNISRDRAREVLNSAIKQGIVIKRKDPDDRRRAIFELQNGNDEDLL
jgi:hypothetical protein